MNKVIARCHLGALQRIAINRRTCQNQAAINPGNTIFDAKRLIEANLMGQGSK